MNKNLKTPTHAVALGTCLVLVGAVAGGAFGQETADDGIPANKVAVSGSALDILSTPVSEGASSEVHTLLTSKLKTSRPTDLILQVTTECALWTDVTTIGNDESEAVASVKLWVEVDGKPVRVADNDVGDDEGKVVFCNRAYKRTTTQFEDENATIETYLKTRSANAFNWVLIDPQPTAGGIHTIEVKAQLDAEVTGLGMAKAGIGKRTLVVEPVKLAQNAIV